VRRQEKDSAETGDRRIDSAETGERQFGERAGGPARPTKKEGENGQLPGSWPYRKVGEKKESKNGRVPGTWLKGNQEIG
jgi:hypothetical protein